MVTACPLSAVEAQSLRLCCRHLEALGMFAEPNLALARVRRPCQPDLDILQKQNIVTTVTVEGSFLRSSPGSFSETRSQWSWPVRSVAGEFA
jgi:hypothetical protein